MKLTYIALAAALVGLSACSVPQGWSVDGAVNGAPEGTRLALENYSNGRWLLVDSLTVNNESAFGYDATEAAHYPELMRLVLPGRGSVCFPVDSVDNILISADYDNFGHAEITGTPEAEAFMRVDSIVAAHGNRITEALRYELAGMVTQDTSGIVSYYIVSKSIGNERIFEPDDAFGNRIYGAAANVYAMHRPTDPRGTALRQAHFEGRRALGRVPQVDSVLEVPATGVIEIDLYDNAGRRHKLSELAAQGKVILLDFTTYQAQDSPVYNAELNSLYTRYHDRGLEIYQVAIDDNEVDWKQVAVNLPWITVWNSPADGDTVLRSYYVTALPTSFIIDRNGEIKERVENPQQLASQLARYF